MAKPCGKFHGNYMIRQIVGRLHVGTPDDEVVDYFKSRLKKGFWEKKMTAVQRRDAECEVRRVHAENLKMYRDVMTGRF